MNLKGHKIFFSLLVIFILIGCDYSRTPPKKIEKYQYGDGHIIKDSPDKELYLEYLNERSDLETRYMTKFNNLKSKESEYQKIKATYASQYKDHVDYARSKIPELNNTIDAIEEEIQIRKAKLRDVKDELVEVGLLPSNNKAVSTAEEKINELEKIATDLIVKRADLYLNYRTSSLDFDGLDSEERLQSLIDETLRTINQLLFRQSIDSIIINSH